MPEESAEILKKVLKDISHIQELVDNSKSLQRTLKKVYFDNEDETNKIIENTKTLVDKLKTEVGRIDTYFQKHYSKFSNDNTQNTVQERKAYSTGKNDRHKRRAHARIDPDSEVGKGTEIDPDTSSSIDNEKTTNDGVEEPTECLENNKQIPENNASIKEVSTENETNQESDDTVASAIGNKSGSKDEMNDDNDKGVMNTEHNESNTTDDINNDKDKEIMDTEPCALEKSTIVNEKESSCTSETNADKNVTTNQVTSPEGCALEESTNNNQREHSKTSETNIDESVHADEDMTNSDPCALNKERVEEHVNRDVNAAKDREKVSLNRIDTSEPREEERSSTVDTAKVVNNTFQGNLNGHIEKTVELSEDNTEIVKASKEPNINNTEVENTENEKTSDVDPLTVQSPDLDKAKEGSEISEVNGDKETGSEDNASIDSSKEKQGTNDDEKSEKDIKEENIWKIKCVDISKLLNPNLLSNETDKDEDSVVILSDSDGESSLLKRKFSDTKKLKILLQGDLDKKNKNNNKAVTQSKNVIVLEDSDSSDDAAISIVKTYPKLLSGEVTCRKVERLSNNRSRKERDEIAKTQKNTTDSLKKRVRFNISDENSSNDASSKGKITRSQARNKKPKYRESSSEEEEESHRKVNRKQKKKTPRDLVNVSSFSETSSDSENDSERRRMFEKKKQKKLCSESLVRKLLSAEKDRKFSWKSYVPLMRIPAQKLKENYQKRTLKDEVKRLTNMDSLKRTRHVRKGSHSSSESADSVEVKKKRTRKVNGKNATDKADSSSDGFETVPDPLAVSDTRNDIEEKDKALDANGGKNKEDTLPGTNNEDNVVRSLLDGINSASDSSNHDSSNDTDAEKEKEKAKKKESKGDDKEEKKTKNDKAGSDESEKERESSATDKKKKWRNDKLLSEKLSESDSDENFEKFTKKRDKQAETVLSDTDDVAPKVIKRSGKRKGRIVNSDSESSSSNKKKSGSDDDDDSKNSSESSDSDVQGDKEKKSKRRRIKKLQDSSDEAEGDDKSTRKQIRKVWANDSLAETTKQAEKEEQERKARIADRQQKYNQIFESDMLEKAKVDKVILDFNEETNEELLKIDRKIVKNLKPHQAKGIQFMWNSCFESLERAKNTTGSGCILAHCMGLGKTLQVIALIHALISNEEETGVTKVLVVAPLSTVLNWVAEFKKWIPEDDGEVEVYDLVSYKQNYERQYQVQEWSKRGGVLILGYDMYRNLTNMTNKRMNKKMRNIFQSCLVDPGPDMVVCDEGHLLKNEKTSISIAMNRLRTLRRIVLTGTPLQNNLKEYFCMVQFVKPNLLGTYKEYLNRFVNPITNGQYTDSTPHDIQIMRKRSHVLHKLLDGVVQRNDYSVLAPFLPPKFEYILFINLTDVQIKLYEFYLKTRSRRGESGPGKSYLFIDFQELLRICTHPRVLLDKSIEVKLAKEKKDLFDDEEESEGSLKDFIDDGSTSADNSTSSSNNSASDSESSKTDKKTTKPKRVTRATASNTIDLDKEEEEVIPQEHDPAEWWRQFCEGDELDCINYSGKLFLLFEILHECELIGDKVLVFSQSLYSLNVIEYFLNKIDEGTQKGDISGIGGYSASWSLGLDYYRLDGSSSCDNRAAWCKSFNNPENTRARLFLISTRAGGLGINLVAANRVIIFDVSWNPSHDIQSIYRIYRFGQTKPCYVYRFVTLGTMEMKIYERQVIKQSISKRVIDEQQIDRHYNQNDLAELYKFEPKPEEERPIPLVPKDVLLGELLQKHDDRVFKYHEHQSLLENKEDEVLNEDERKAAWEEFEYEKKARQFPAVIQNLPITSIVRALTSIIQKDNPSWDNVAIQNCVPELVKELQDQLNVGNMTMYNRVLTEMRLMQSARQQLRVQEFYFRQQQQALMRQYQQQFMNNANQQFMTNPNEPYFTQFQQQFVARTNNPGSSTMNLPRQTNLLQPSRSTEVIDLND